MGMRIVDETQPSEGQERLLDALGSDGSGPIAKSIEMPQDIDQRISGLSLENSDGINARLNGQGTRAVFGETTNMDAFNQHTQEHGSNFLQEHRSNLRMGS